MCEGVGGFKNFFPIISIESEKVFLVKNQLEDTCKNHQL